MEFDVKRPLTRAQVDAAREVQRTLKGWVGEEEAILEIHRRFPDFDRPACLVKVAAVNSFYGTYLFDVPHVAEHIYETRENWKGMGGVQLVENIGSIRMRGGKNWNVQVFSSKFCHLFVDASIPIMDSVVRDEIRNYVEIPTTRKDYPYRTLHQAFVALAKASGMPGRVRDLDCFLWLVGTYRKWERTRDTKGGPKVNREAQDLFNEPTPRQRALFEQIGLPVTPPRNDERPG